jgi:4-methyl-5(b-hydroxyethyl)-thiazole monophosphate biosynthesis
MALCAAPACFADWGILDTNVKVTSYPGVAAGKFEKNYVKNDIVISKNFITGAGPGIASDFAFKVVEEFVSPTKAKDLKKEMLF